MKKYIAVIEKRSHEVIYLEARDPKDLIDWRNSIASLPNLTLNKLRDLENEPNGFWRFLKIQSEDETEIIQNFHAPPALPNITVFGACPHLTTED